MPPDDASILILRPGRITRNIGAAGLLMVVLVTTGLLTDPNGLAALPARPNPGLVAGVLGIVFVTFSTMCVGMLAVYRRHALILSSDSLTVRGLFRVRTIPWDAIREVRWRSSKKYPDVLLRTTGRRLVLDLSPFAFSHPERIVETLRNRLDPALHHDWDRFAVLRRFDDRGRPQHQPDAELSTLDEAEAARNRGRWDRWFPWVAASGAAVQVMILDAAPLDSRMGGAAFLPILIVALWPAPGAFAPSGTIRWFRTMPEDVRREVVACMAILARMTLVAVGLIVLVPAMMLGSIAGSFLLLNRFAPGWAGPETAKVMGAGILGLLLLIVLIPLERRRKREIERRVAERRAGASLADPDRPS